MVVVSSTSFSSQVKLRGGQRTISLCEQVLSNANLMDEELEANLADAMLLVDRKAHYPYAEDTELEQDVPVAIRMGRMSSDDARLSPKPSVVARMLGFSGVRPDETVLVAGLGSGYMAAVLLKMGCHVYGLEETALVSREARRLLDAQGLMQLLVRGGPIVRGWSAHAPYDVILCLEPLSELPVNLLSQLHPNGAFVGLVGTREEQQIVRAEYAEGGGTGGPFTVTQLGSVSSF